MIFLEIKLKIFKKNYYCNSLNLENVEITQLHVEITFSIFEMLSYLNKQNTQIESGNAVERFKKKYSAKFSSFIFANKIAQLW